MISRRTFTVSSLCASLPTAIPATPAFATSEPNRRILVVVGPSKHPPGTHEVLATGKLLQHCIQHLGAPGVAVELLSAWPDDSAILEQTSSIVFVGDFFPPARMEGTAKIMSDLTAMMARGCGMVCVHYATGLGAQDVAEDGEHPLLHWIGGYFATRCKHHQSVAKVFESATIVPKPISHDILRGWKSFTIHDEPYINNYFGKSGMAADVVPLATASLPPENPKEEVVAWAVERPDSGRGIGIVMPHFYRNWRQNDLRKMILNSIAWSAKLEVPQEGYKVALPELATFGPDSLEPIVRAKAK
jgi:Trehalose utilisation